MRGEGYIMTSRRYDVLLCDADDTLFDFLKAEANAFAIACEAAGFSSTPELLSLYSRINDALWKELERGGITQAVLRVRRFEQFLEATGRPGDPAAIADIYAEALGRQAIPLEGALEAVTRWSEILPVVIVTNGISQIQRGRMALSPIRHVISGMVVSEEVGVAKPDPRMLFEAMRVAGVEDPRRALMLGDSLTSDIAGAANAGVDACWFNRHGKKNERGLPIRYEITSLLEVDDILLGRREEARG